MRKFFGGQKNPNIVNRYPHAYRFVHIFLERLNSFVRCRIPQLNLFSTVISVVLCVFLPQADYVVAVVLCLSRFQSDPCVLFSTRSSVVFCRWGQAFAQRLRSRTASRILERALFSFDAVWKHWLPIIWIIQASHHSAARCRGGSDMMDDSHMDCYGFLVLFADLWTYSLRHFFHFLIKKLNSHQGKVREHSSPFF